MLLFFKKLLASTIASFCVPQVEQPWLAAGLENLGNTCFVNVSAQVLLHVHELVTAFRTTESSRQSGQGLADAFGSLAALCRQPGTVLVNPGGLVTTLRTIKPGMFPVGSEGDAHEALLLMLDQLADGAMRAVSPELVGQLAVRLNVPQLEIEELLGGFSVFHSVVGDNFASIVRSHSCSALFATT